MIQDGTNGSGIKHRQFHSLPTGRENWRAVCSKPSLGCVDYGWCKRCVLFPAECASGRTKRQEWIEEVILATTTREKSVSKVEPVQGKRAKRWILVPEFGPWIKPVSELGTDSPGGTFLFKTFAIVTHQSNTGMGQQWP